jgi:hypothetical protein
MAMCRSIRLRFIVILVISFSLFPTLAQDSFQDVIEMSIEVGFDSFFRPNEWTPVRVQVKNNGDSITGRLVIRPETSGTVVGNAFSTPIDLPNGAEKSAIINIQARTFPDVIRVELIADDDFIHTSKEANLIDLRPQDQLYAVVTGANTAPISLAGVHIGGYEAEQASWDVNNIPDRGLALQSLDMMMLINIDSENLSTGQRSAIQSWVIGGGHLIITGGPSAQSTAVAFNDISPLLPNDTQSLDDLSALAVYSGHRDTELDERTIIAVGDLHTDATVLVEHDGIPLLARRELGAGIIDYLVADPTLEPLTSWDNSSSLWLTLLASRSPQPVWTDGFTRSLYGAEAIANLPGVDLLPPIQTLCLFLIAYIILIGPVNYLILSYFNRNGWGWLTIPLVIALFTGIAWTVGFNLRGSEIIASRTTVVQSWANTDTAQMNQFLGVLSPRRTPYSLTVPENHFMGVTGATASTNFFSSTAVQTSTEIQQGTNFGAYDFVIDGGIFANFVVSGDIQRPDIGGAVTLDFDIAESGRMVGGFQGVIRNNSDFTLRDAVIVGGNTVYQLEEDFAPDDLLTFNREDLTMAIGDYAAQPNLLEYVVSVQTNNRTSPFSRSGGGSSIDDIQGDRFMRSRAFNEASSIDEKQTAREQAFLASFMLDQFDSTSRSTNAYLIGWRDEWERDLDIVDTNWRAVDTTLYIIELDVTVELPIETATLTTEHFTWMSLDRVGVTNSGTDNLKLYEAQEVEYLFSPLPELIMTEVDQLVVEVDRGGGFARNLEVELYNWQNKTYELFTFSDGDILEFDDPQDYLGHNNQVRIRLYFGDGNGSATVRKIRVKHTGRYS